MPLATNDGVSLYYESDGSGPTVAFVEDAGYGAWLWGWQHAALGPYERLVWDLRGTGRSDTPSGPYTVETLAADLEAVLSDHGARSAHLVGAGLGGMVALQYALSYGRAETLTLLGTAAAGAGVDVEALERLFAPPDDADALRDSLDPAFSPAFFEEQPPAVDGIVDWRAEDDADEEGWQAQVAAVTAFDLRDRLYEITQPALVLHGREDPVVPVDAGEDLAEALPRGEFESVDGRHLFFVERSRPVNDTLLGFLDEQTGE